MIQKKMLMLLQKKMLVLLLCAVMAMAAVVSMYIFISEQFASAQENGPEEGQQEVMDTPGSVESYWVDYSIKGEAPAEVSGMPDPLSESREQGEAVEIAPAPWTASTTNAAEQQGTWSFDGWVIEDENIHVVMNVFVMPDRDVTIMGSWTFALGPVIDLSDTASEPEQTATPELTPTPIPKPIATPEPNPSPIPEPDEIPGPNLPPTPEPDASAMPEPTETFDLTDLADVDQDEIEQILPPKDTKDYQIEAAAKKKEESLTSREVKASDKAIMAFWEKALPILNEKVPAFKNINTPSSNSWRGASLGKRDVMVKSWIFKTSTMIEVALCSTDKEYNKNNYQGLLRFRDELDKAFNGKLIWEEKMDQKYSSIYLAGPEENYGWSNEDHWSQIIEYLVDGINRIDKEFKPLMKKI